MLKCTLTSGSVASSCPLLLLWGLRPSFNPSSQGWGFFIGAPFPFGLFMTGGASPAFGVGGGWEPPTLLYRRTKFDHQHGYKLNGNELALPEPRFFSSGIQLVCVLAPGRPPPDAWSRIVTGFLTAPQSNTGQVPTVYNVRQGFLEIFIKFL